MAEGAGHAFPRGTSHFVSLVKGFELYFMDPPLRSSRVIRVLNGLCGSTGLSLYFELSLHFLHRVANHRGTCLNLIKAFSNTSSSVADKFGLVKSTFGHRDSCSMVYGNNLQPRNPHTVAHPIAQTSLTSQNRLYLTPRASPPTQYHFNPNQRLPVPSVHPFLTQFPTPLNVNSR